MKNASLLSLMGWISALMCSACISLNASANLTELGDSQLNLVLADPQWTMVINNLPAQNGADQIRSDESSFGQKIKPLLEKSQYAEVVKAFEARPLANDSPALQVLRAQVLLNTKQLAKAEQALTAALVAAPHFANAHRSLSMVYMQQQKYTEARKHLIKSIELGNADAQVYGQLAFVNLQTHNAFSAVAGYQQALFLEPDSAQWQQGLAYALTQAQAFDQAQALI